MRFKLLPVALLSGLAAHFQAAAADDTADTIKALQQRIEQLDQKVRILERKDELDKEASVEKAKTATTVSIGQSGFQVRSGDSNFVLKVRGYVQADGRFYADQAFPAAPSSVPGSRSYPASASDTFLLRRVRPIFEGTVFENYDYRVMLDFGQGVSSSAANNGFVQDAYTTARFLPEFQVFAGKLKEPVGLERLQSGANLLFVERGLPTQLVPNRDVGAGVQGDFLGGALSYAAGAFNGVADGGSGDFDISDTSDAEKDIAARIFAHPFKNTAVDGLKGLGVGVAGTYGHQDGPLRPYSTPGAQRFFTYYTGLGTNASRPNVVADGAHWRLSPQAYYYWGPFGAFGEYVISSQEVRRDNGARTFKSFNNTAWQVAASYFLTGEENSWKAVTPKKNFNPANGGWGAWEVAARVGELKLDEDIFSDGFASPDVSAHKAFSWGAGLNWHLNRNIKVNLTYDQTTFSGGTSPLLKNGEHALFTRAQFSW
jgi:phosphate-selective porin OprO/OprP